MKPPAHKHPQKAEMNVVPYIDVMLAPFNKKRKNIFSLAITSAFK